MLKSMTGYGRAERRFPFGSIIVEVKTLNHRFLDIVPRLPNSLAAFEGKMKEQVQRKIRRGRVNISVFLERKMGPEEGICIDRELAKKYRDQLSKLARSLRLKDELSLSHVISLPNVITYRAPEEDLGKLWFFVKRVLNAALDEVVKARQKEGRNLSRDLTSRARNMASVLRKIKRRSPVVVKLYRERLWKALKGTRGAEVPDRERLEREVALFAKSCDTSEEVTRMSSHIKSFVDTVASGREAGKRLDFIAQELYREANTIGAKASDFKIQREVIEVKSQIEKIREQLQNVE